MQNPIPPANPLRDDVPLASYVLRVRGRPATLRFELLDLRSGERHVFRRTDSVVAFLQKLGLGRDDTAALPGRPIDQGSTE